MEDSTVEGAPLNKGDFGGGELDPDDAIQAMDQEAIAQEKSWQDDFREESTVATVADVVDDEGDAKDIMPGAEEAQAQGDPTDKDKDDEEKELTDELFEKALTSEEQKDIDDLNKRFGTDYKDMKSFEEKFKKEEGKDEEATKMETTQKIVGYLENLLKADDKEILYQDLRIAAHNKGLDVTDPDLDAGFKAEVDEAEANGTLKYVSRALRTEANAKLEKNVSELTRYNESKVQTAEQKASEAAENLKQATTKIYQKGKFYGLEVSQDQHMNAYRDASNKTLIKEMEANPELLVEMTLLWANREGIAKISDSPSYSAGVKATFDAIKGQKSKHTAKVVTDKAPGSDLPTYIADWIK